jgi:hypothetical protein
MNWTSYIDPAHLQYWRAALDAELQLAVDQANKYTRNAPWRVRLRLTKERLRWWHWRKATVHSYQVLKAQGDGDDAYTLYCQGAWVDRDEVLSFFEGFAAAMAVSLSQTFFSEVPAQKEST